MIDSKEIDILKSDIVSRDKTILKLKKEIKTLKLLPNELKKKNFKLRNAIKTLISDSEEYSSSDDSD